MPTALRARPWVALLLRALLVLALVGALVLASRFPVERPLAWLTEVQALGFWGPLAFAALFVVLTVALLPATPVALAAGAVFGPAVGTVTISLAATVSAIFSFLLARYVAHDRIAARIHHYPKLEALWRAAGARPPW